MHGIANNSLRVDTSIAGYVGLLPGGRTILHGIARVDTSIARCAELRNRWIRKHSLLYRIWRLVMMYIVTVYI